MFVGYVRVSHVGSREGESFRSPTEQAEQIQMWAKLRGVEVEVLEPELDESGARLDRPILEKAIKGIESGRWEGLVVAYLSRFARSTKHLLHLTDRIEAAGGSVVFVAENLDTSTPAGRMQRTILAAVAEQERDVKVEDFARRTEDAVARGLWKFRQLPLGYKLAKRRPSGLAPSVDAPKVKWAFHARAGGASITSIAAKIRMTPNGTRRLLANRVYLGEIRVGKFVNAEAHEPLIDAATFDQVQAMHGKVPARSKRPALLAGLIRCQSCGHVMARMNPKNPTYRCHVNHSAGRCPAPAGISAHRIEPYVSEIARAEIQVLTFSVQRRSGEGEKLRAEMTRAESELAAYLEATEVAGLPMETFVAGSRKRQATVEAARARLDAFYAISPIGEGFADGAEFWDDLKVHERNTLLRGLIEAVVILPVGRGVSLPPKDRTRIFAKGTIDVAYRGGGVALPIAALPFPDADDPRLLGVASFEDRLRSTGG